MTTLYGMASPNVVKIVLMLEELEAPYDFEYVDVANGSQFTDRFGALTPNRKVPVIVDEDGPRGADGGPFTLWESGAILIYLAEKHGRFIPADPHARLMMLQWLMFQMASIGPMGGQLAHFTIFAPQAEHGYARARYATEVKRIYDVVEAQLTAQPWLAGEDYTIADVAAWPWLKAAGRRGVDLATLPAVKRWIEAIAARPAAIRTERFFAELDTSAMAARIRDGGDPLDRYLGRGRYSRPELATE